MDIVEIIGYMASVFIVLSFMLKDVRKIRIINLIGCICFVIYGTMGEELRLPIAIPNAILCFIQAYYLIKKI